MSETATKPKEPLNWRKGSGSGSSTCSADGEHTFESYLWDDLPESIREALIATGRFDDSAVHKPPVVVLVEPSGLGCRAWHSTLPSAVLTALTNSYDADVVVYDIKGKTARVWFDVVGITL